MLGLFVGWQLNGPMLIAGGLCLGSCGRSDRTEGQLSD